MSHVSPLVPLRKAIAVAVLTVWRFQVSPERVSALARGRQFSVVVADVQRIDYRCWILESSGDDLHHLVEIVEYVIVVEAQDEPSMVEEPPIPLPILCGVDMGRTVGLYVQPLEAAREIRDIGADRVFSPEPVAQRLAAQLAPQHEFS